MVLALCTLLVAGFTFAGAFMELIATRFGPGLGTPMGLFVAIAGAVSAGLWFGAAIAIARGKGLAHWSVRLASLYSVIFTLGAGLPPVQILGGAAILVGLGFPALLIGIGKMRPLPRAERAV